MITTNTPVGQALRLARTALGWSQTKLADEADISISAIAGVEQGNVQKLGPRIEGPILRALMANGVDQRLLADLQNAQQRAVGLPVEGNADDADNGDATGDATGTGDSTGERTLTPAPVASSSEATPTPMPRPSTTGPRVNVLDAEGGGWIVNAFVPATFPEERIGEISASVRAVLARLVGS